MLTLMSATVLAVTDPQEQSSLDKLEKKMQVIGDYYQQVNNKLNNKDSSFIQPNSRRDPFSYTEQMYRNQPKQVSNRPKGNNLTSKAALRANTTAFSADGLPIMKYRGYAESPTGEVVGILEVLGMGVYTVRVGDQIGLHDIVKELVLTVEGLSRNNIIIKTGKLGQQLVIQ